MGAGLRKASLEEAGSVLGPGFRLLTALLQTPGGSGSDAYPDSGGLGGLRDPTSYKLFGDAIYGLGTTPRVARV